MMCYSARTVIAVQAIPTFEEPYGDR